MSIKYKNKTIAGVLTLDNTPTSGNTDSAISSDAVYTALAGKASLDSPALTGTPTAPTAIAGTNSTQIATTAFVQNANKYQSNPNLLDNWYFSGGGSLQGGGQFPINLRGVSTYAGAENVYTIDRWYANSARGSIKIKTNRILLVRTASGGGPFRLILSLKTAISLSCIFSILMFTELASGYNIILLDESDNVLSTVTSETGGSSWKVLSVYYDGTGNAVAKVGIGLGTTVAVDSELNILAAKLELGDTQTLAHNEGTNANPVWVLNEIPDYQEQLLRCKTAMLNGADPYAYQAISMNVPNQNLLDNWYFPNAVNQRGQLSYTGAIRGLDRWGSSVGYTIAELSTAGYNIKSSNGTNFGIVEQVIDNPSRLLGMHVTLTALTNTNLISATAKIPSSFSDTTIINTNGVILLMTSNGNLVVRIGSNTTTGVLFKAVKLELGTAQTLCHNEGTKSNPVWVLNEIPNFQQELAKCQRYLYCIRPGTNSHILYGFAISATAVRFTFNLPVVMPNGSAVSSFVGDVSGLTFYSNTAMANRTITGVSAVATQGNFCEMEFAGTGMVTSEPIRLVV